VRRPQPLDASPARARRGERSQALVEFALVAPALLLLTFGIIDFGRGMYFYVTIGNSAREVARYTESASVPMPTFTNAFATAVGHSAGMILRAPCPSGPVTGTPPKDTAWVFITEPSPPTTIEASPPPNAPGGDTPASSIGSCSAVNPAIGRSGLQVTIIYNFVPVTPLVRDATAANIVLTARVYLTTEY